MSEVKEIRISYIKNADIHNVPFQIPIVPCSQNPVDYQQLLNRNFTALESYRGYPIPLRTKIAYFLVFACKEKNYPTYSHLLNIPYNTYKKIGELTPRSNPAHRIRQHLLKSDATLSNIRGHQRVARYNLLEQALLLLIKSVNDIGLLENPSQFKRHAIEIELEIRQKSINDSNYPEEPFTCTQNFREGFFRRHNLGFRTASGTSAGVTIGREDVIEYIKEQIPDYDSYTADRLLNLDESALFYEMLGTRTIGFVGEEVHGRATSKKRVSLCATVFASGDTLPIAFIGSSMQPHDMRRNNLLWHWLRLVGNGKHCWQKFENINAIRGNSKKGWMNSDLFKQILLYIDSHPKVLPNSLLLLDNYGAHVMMPAFLESLVRIKVAFLPPNCTSEFQPLDAGLFYAMKCRYRKMFINEHMKSLDSTAMNILVRKGLGEVISDTDIQLLKESLFGSIQTASPTTFELAKFISRSWDSIDSNMVIRAWVRSDCLPNNAKRQSIQQLILNEVDNPQLKAANTRLLNRLNIQRAQFNSEATNLPLPVDPMDVDTFTDEYTAQIERNLQLNEIDTLFDGFYY